MKNSNFGKIGIYTLLIVGALMFCIPFIFMVSTSLKPAADVYAIPPELIPRDITFESYQKLLMEYGFAVNIATSFIVAIATVVGQIVFASMSGYALARFEFKGRNFLYKVLLALYIVPFIIIVIPLFIEIKEFGWVDSYAALIIPKWFTVFSIFFMRQFFITLPRELEEASALDGYSTIETFFKVMLPQMKPAIATLAILGFMGSWNDYLWPLIAAGKDVVTLPVAMSQLYGAYTTDWAIVMAAATLSIIPILIIFITMQKYIVKGMSNTGLK